MKRFLTERVFAHLLGLALIPVVWFLLGLGFALLLAFGILITLGLILLPGSVTLNGVKLLKIIRGVKDESKRKS